ncbi:putative ribonuclease H-like domain-containing protein [Tanacetum coccineum]
MTKNVTEHVEPKKVWTLMDLPHGKRAIGTKWVYGNKKDERGIVIRNKARLVAQGYTQEEGIDYDEVFALVARIEAIRLFLAYASFKDFVGYQMDLKSAFLYGKIEEEVYVCQPSGFEDPECPDKVNKTENSTTAKPGVNFLGGDDLHGNVLWIQNQMLDYEYNFMNTKIFIDNESTICMIRPSLRCGKIEWKRAITTASSLEAEHDSGLPIIGGAEAQIRFEAASKQSNDPPLSRVNTLGSGEDNMKLKELMEFCTKLFSIVRLKTERELVRVKIHDGNAFRSEVGVNAGVSKLMLLDLNLLLPVLVYAARHSLTAVRHNLQEKVLDLEKAKTAQANEIASLKKIVKQLEKIKKSKNSGLERLRKNVCDADSLLTYSEEIKAAKPKAVTTAATTTTTTRPKARGVVVQEPSEFKTTSSPLQASQLLQDKIQGKADSMIEADRLLAERLQIREQEELTDEEKARLFVDLLEKRKKHLAALRAKEKEQTTH